MPSLCHQWRGLSQLALRLQVAISLLLFSRYCLEAVEHDRDPEASCEQVVSSDRLGGSNLLQVHAGFPMPVGTGPNGMRRPGDAGVRSHAILTAPDDESETARGVLPDHLFELGRELFGSEERLDELVANSRMENITYAGVSVLTRMVNGDMSNTEKAEDADRYYDLDTLRDTSPNGMLHMLDLGGNYGVVSIAAFKKYPQDFRGVIVEPILTTYFFLQWNLWLNGVPLLAQMDASASTPGIMPLNNAVSDADGKEVGFCFKPPYTMNAFACDCQQKLQNGPDECVTATGISTASLMQLFGTEPIALMKVDCEGCEADSLPQMMNITKMTPGRIKRLAGELHAPSKEIEDIACLHDSGAHFVKICLSDGKYDSAPLRCDGNRTSCHNQMPFLEQLRLFIG